MTIVIAILLALIFWALIKDKPRGWLIGESPALTAAAFTLFFISLCLYYFGLFLSLSDSETSEQSWYYWPTILFWVFGFPALLFIDKGAMAKRVFYESRKEFFKLSFICLCSTGGFFVYVLIYQSTELWVHENKVLGYLICISIFSIPWLIFVAKGFIKKQMSIRLIVSDVLKGIIFFISLYLFGTYWNEIVAGLASKVHYFWVAKGFAIFSFIYIMFKVFESIDMRTKKK
ncbi:hypothetical protein ICN46_07670 [Polynucleobacter sp. Latsch14-2]|uniref:hypothetical protein n=1 Tax=Polynucleobacter sp. Latsch14-2 TaxID=2576920 RepID=UPI001C0BFA3E|nr:hypothetical protein [Polynucleobacter sp. Latsch14-2]MBU3614771.1 hypothetical protein [Polynucleobacter sp. Latsch14-2]